jgi:MFS family permease
MKSPGTRGSSGAVVGTVALASLLNPLNTSMLAVALPQLQREFGTSAGASTWLHTVFAFVSAIAHPLAGVLADRLGPRRVLIAGLCVTGASALAAASVERFSLLLSLRAVQALGTSTAFPAGMALLRMINAREYPLPAAWLGTVAMTGNLGAAEGPILAAGLLGSMVADAPNTDRLYQLWIVTGLLSVVLLVWATRSSTKTGTPLSMRASRTRGSARSASTC